MQTTGRSMWAMAYPCWSDPAHRAPSTGALPPDARLPPNPTRTRTLTRYSTELGMYVPRFAARDRKFAFLLS
jgi:hypothetical protein